jgi:hypothetical protein
MKCFRMDFGPTGINAFIPLSFSLFLLILLTVSCSESKKQMGEEELIKEGESGIESRPPVRDTLFNEPNLSTDYFDIQVSIGELEENEGGYSVEVKVDTKRENYHIEMVGNQTDGQGNIKGTKVDSFYGPGAFEHTYVFEQIEGFRPNLILLSIYNPIDGNWNDLKFRYFREF